MKREDGRKEMADYKIKAMDDELLAEGFTCDRCSRPAVWLYIQKLKNKKEYGAFEKRDKHIRHWNSTEKLCELHAVEVQL